MLIQKSMRPDSIVLDFYSTASPRRLLQHNLAEPDSAPQQMRRYFDRPRASDRIAAS
jgi:hypothetical protein